MKNKAQLVVMCCWFLIGVIPEVGAVETISQISQQELLTILKEEGYLSALVEPSMVSMKAKGLDARIYIAPGNESIQAFSGVESKNVTLYEINEWNKNKRFSCAYLDKEAGIIIIKFDLDLEGGISRERLVNFFRIVRISIPLFKKQFSGAD